MRIFGIILLSFYLCFASILSLNEAFNVKSNSYNNSISIDIELGKDIYLYSKKLKLYINEKDISSLINLPQSSTRGNEIVYYQKLNLALPNLLLERFAKNTTNLIKLEFQGCSEQGLCYNPQTWYFDLISKKDAFEISKPYKTQKTDKKTKIESEESTIANF